MAGNVSASVRERLLNYAKASSADYNQVLIRHAIERLLYRLALSPHCNSFVLKGAMLFTVWSGSPHRPTRDLDLLGFGDPSQERLVKVFKDICLTHSEEDGWKFDADTVSAEAIRTADEYGGVRMHLIGRLGSAIVRMQIDIGFGDAITPLPVEAAYPVMLKQSAPQLRMYPRSTVVAEKAEAITKLGMVNTRFKDFYDLKFLAEKFDADGPEIVAAIQATFARRGTPLPLKLPTGLTSEFAEDSVKQRQWEAFTRRLGEPGQTLPQVVAVVAGFLEAPLKAAQARHPFPLQWVAGKAWRE